MKSNLVIISCFFLSLFMATNNLMAQTLSDSVQNTENEKPADPIRKYFLTPGGEGVRKKEFTYQNYYLIGNYFGYGITNNIKVGLGTALLFKPLVFSAQFNGSITEKLHYNTGYLMVSVDDLDKTFHLPYAGLTYGTAKNRISLGSGLPLSSEFDETVFFQQIAFALTVWKKLMFISENLIYTYNSDEYGCMGISGFRFKGNINWQFDLGALYYIIDLQRFESGVDPWPLPYIGAKIYF